MSKTIRSCQHYIILALTTFVLCLNLGLSACSHSRYAYRHDHAPKHYQDVNAIPDATPKQEAPSRYGNPNSYKVNGQRYYVRASASGYKARGFASWYGMKFHGHRTSSGDIYDVYGMTAAHKTLPLPTYAKVTNLQNGHQVIVKINDRGPFHPQRLIDLSYAAAKKLGIVGHGTGYVEIEALDPQAEKLAQHHYELDNTAVADLATTRYLETPTARNPAQPREPATAPKPTWSLQVAALSDRPRAEQLANRLQSRYQVPAHVETSTLQTTPIFRVKLGPFASIERLNALKTQLRDISSVLQH